MRMFIIPEKDLRKLVCSNCGKYLSVLPIKTTIKGDVCGRCSDIRGAKSSVENRYKEGLFRCINWYDGCNKLILFENSKKHEEKCTSVSHACPICPSFSCTTLEMMHHYKQYHKSHFVNSYKVTCDVSEEKSQTYLYYSDVVLCFWYLQFEDKKLSARCVSLGSSDEACLITQQLIIDRIDGQETKYFSKVQHCNGLNNPEEHKISVPFNYIKQFADVPRQFDLRLRLNFVKINRIYELEFNPQKKIIKVPPTPKKGIKEKRHIETQTNNVTNESENSQEKAKVQVSDKCVQTELYSEVVLTDQFKENHPNFKLSPCGTAVVSSTTQRRIELVCSNCLHFTGTNVLRCINKLHVVCWDCKAWCTLCDDKIFDFATESSTINDDLLIPCRWACDKKFSGGNLRDHEKICPVQPQISCPVLLCDYRSIPINMKNHFTLHRQFDFFTEWPMNLSHIGRRHSYFLLGSRMFKVSKSDDSTTVEIQSMSELTDHIMVLIVMNMQIFLTDGHPVVLPKNENVKFLLRRNKSINIYKQ